MAAKLKVFRAEIGGTHEYVVAARSQKEAAEIWGTDIDVFRNGRGGPTTIPSLVDAAMEKPGTPLRRVLGKKGPFGPIPKGNDLEAWRLALMAEGVKPGARRAKPPPPPKPPKEKPTPPPKPERPRPDRSALDAAEAALAAFEARAETQTAALKAEMDTLASRQAALRKFIRDERDALTKKLRIAKDAYEKQKR
jgi:hypothetical protein